MSYLFRIIRCFAALLILAFTVSISPVSAQSAGQVSLTAQQFEELYTELPAADVLSKASAGDPYAILEMGNRFAAGTGGFPFNQSEAARYFSLASSIGYPGSPSLEGIPRNPIRAARPAADGSTVPQAPTTPLPPTEHCGHQQLWHSTFHYHIQS